MSHVLSQQVHLLVLSLPRYGFATSSSALPLNGIYFFFELGEIMLLDGMPQDRIVRVGTHRTQNRLPQRITDHYGPYSHLSGSRSGSVFRRHVGSAILLSVDPYTDRVAGWYGKERPPFEDVEKLVSSNLRTNFSFACIPVPTSRERLQLEAGLIALIAQYPLASPSTTWLGQYASNDDVRSSGLWNSQHVHDNPLTTDQFNILKNYASP